MELKLYFTKEEIEKYLRDKGFTIETIPSWNSINEYQGKISYENVEIKIAYIDRPDQEFLERSSRDIKMKFGIEEIFSNEIKQQLLNG